MLTRRTGNFPSLSNDRTLAPIRISEWIDEVMDEALGWDRASRSSFVPELNVAETATEFELTLAVPGMDKEDFEISYEHGVLTISGERKMEQEKNGRRFHHVESRFGRFSRSLPLPADVINDDGIMATYDNGILHITIPKVKEKAGKKIKVN